MRNIALGEWIAVGALGTTIVAAIAQVMSVPFLSRWIEREWTVSAAPADAAPGVVVSIPPSTPGDPVFKQKPAFDCSRARRWSETMICSSQELAGLDQKLNMRYQAVMAGIGASRQRALLYGERAWIGSKEKCSLHDDAIGCLRLLYKSRIEWLDDQIK